jgi:hypothetical protein
MAQPKIKKRAASSSSKASVLPRANAVPCLVLVVLALIVIALILFFSLRFGQTQ